MSSSFRCNLSTRAHTRSTKTATLVALTALLVLVATGSRCDYPEYVRGHLAGRTWHVEVDGHLAYLVGGDVRVVDVSDPAQPIEIGSLDALGLVVDVFPAGPRLYVLDRIDVMNGPTALRIVDISDPTDPREIGSLEVPGLVQEVEVIDSLAYLLVDRNYGPEFPPLHPAGLRVIDVSDPAAPFEVGNLLVYGGASGGDVALPFGYGVSDAVPALVVVDLTDPAELVEVGNLPDFRASDVEVSEGFAYAVGGWDGFALSIADVSNPTAPFDTGARAAPGTGYDVEIDTHFAYLVVNDAFVVVDVSDALAPFEIGRIPVNGAVEVAVEGPLAFVAAGDSGLQVLGFDPEAVSCSDGLDNDGDGLIDAGDPHCEDPNDATEHPACSDGIDNDRDGHVDHPGDAGCLSPDDLSEISDCRDGLDNDGDGLVDLADPSCVDRNDPAEEPECRDGFDNDGDGLVDHPEDSDCVIPGDNTERSTAAVTSGDLLVVSDGQLLRLDPATLDYGVVLGGDRSIGDVVTSASGEIFFSDLAAGQIISVDPATGQETPVADVPLTFAPDFHDMAIAGDGSLWVVNFIELFRVEPATGNVTQVLPDGIPLWWGVAESRGIVYVIVSRSDGGVDVLRLDPDTGETEPFAEGVGAGHSSTGLALIAHGPDLLVAVGDEVFRLTPPDPTPVSVATSSWGGLEDIAMAGDGTLYLVEGIHQCGRGGCSYRDSLLSSAPSGGSAVVVAGSDELHPLYQVAVFDPAACSDGIDNDGDGLIDHPNDPGCISQTSSIEDPACQDGINNDPSEDSLIDFDGGASAGLPPEQQTDPDSECGYAWQNREASCGLGAELALLLPLLVWLRRRRGSG